MKASRQALRRDGQVGHRAEAAEALAEHAPRPAAGELLPDQFGVGDDRVGAEVGQVVSLLRAAPRARERLPVAGVDRPVPRWSSSSTRKSFSARSSQPIPPCGRGAPNPGPPCRYSSQGRSAWLLVGRDHLPGEQLDLLTAGDGMVKRHAERELIQDGARLPVRNHEVTVAAASGGSRRRGVTAQAGSAGRVQRGKAVRGPGQPLPQFSGCQYLDARPEPEEIRLGVRHRLDRHDRGNPAAGIRDRGGLVG